MPISLVFFVAAMTLFAASVVYLLFATGRVVRYALYCKQRKDVGPRHPVTVMKPVCGLDHGLLDNLRSFCTQDYPDFQIVFGVRSEDDPAIPVIRKVMDEFPGLDTSLVVNDRIVGANFKASNLANMYGAAKHDIIVISDSDMRVEPHYLNRIISSFSGDKVGAVTCLYNGTPVSGIASDLGAMFINEWFLPSALISTTFGSSRFCFGATIAVRRHVLDAIGGFEALATNLADDYMLGKWTQEKGYRIKLAPYAVENIIHEPGLAALFFHELRWARTIRSIQPLGHAMTFLTDLLPLSLLAAMAAWVHAGSPALALVFPAAGLLLRFLFHLLVRRVLVLEGRPVMHLVPLRDIFSFAVRASSFVGRGISWRDRELSVGPGGELKAIRIKT